ncbi:hypothetical protein [Microtetraspora sp. NBRC 13810]|uniref:hypothetical protein n=1 Tax=Microtetraspora sp. NBRC 13810 TaxID=3030990 RepID=UPI0025533861|nr:hypothetical protein [Microtetraspora sp. NBRC 13810]
MPESAVRAPGRFDAAGAGGLTLGLVCLLLAVSKGGEWGWASPITLGMFAAAALVLPVWGWLELRQPPPATASGCPCWRRDCAWRPAGWS